MKKLVIVESPAKAKTIEGYLGEDFVVMSSVGHIRDLAIKGSGGLGVDVDNDFAPTYTYIKGKKKIANDLIKVAKKSDAIFLATDPDREGEAISWHLAEVLELDILDNNRVVFNEITKYGVQNGMQNVRQIDIDLVHSQEGRRIIDRIMGFKLSKLLQQKIKAKSAGRVQSVALLLIVTREQEIRAFIPVEYWNLFANYQGIKLEYVDNRKKVSKEIIEQIYLDIIEDNILICKEIKKKKSKQKPKPAFTTSTFQQAASSILNYNSKKSMMIAQKLYEGIKLSGEFQGLITYMRTDSTRLSSDFVKNGLGYVKAEYGEKYVGFYRFNKVKKNAQDAHEGIRPTSLNNPPSKVKPFLTPEQFKVYELIWRRTISALMSDAEIETHTTLFEHDKKIEFKSVYSTVTFDGFRKLYNENKTEDEQIIDLKISEGEKINVEGYEKTQHFTQPPARYTESKLIKELEEKGIGRPSTYAAIIDILKTRNYVDFQEKKFFPTKEGELVTDNLQKYFEKIINVNYTNELEGDLDKIADGELKELDVLKRFYDDFIDIFNFAQENMTKIEPELLDDDCPECGHKLVIRKGRYGEFTACSNYPECKYIKQEKHDELGECPKCETGKIIEKKTKRAKSFYGCNKYPKCDYAVWNKEDIGKIIEKKKK